MSDRILIFTNNYALSSVSEVTQHLLHLIHLFREQQMSMLNRKHASKGQTPHPPPKFHSLCCDRSWVVIELCRPAGPGK